LASGRAGPIGAACGCGVHDAPPGCAWKHCHEEYVWTPVCFTTAPHHGLVWSYPFPAAPPFGGFFVLPAPPELPEEPGFLQLPFQQTQGKLHIVVMHRDDRHGLPSKVSGREGRPTRAHETRSAVLVLGSAPPARVVAMALAVRWCSVPAATGVSEACADVVCAGGGPSASTTAVHPLHRADRPQRDAALHAAWLHSHLKPARPVPAH